jgi:hypothetical protein
VATDERTLATKDIKRTTPSEPWAAALGEAAHNSLE